MIWKNVFLFLLIKAAEIQKISLYLCRSEDHLVLCLNRNGSFNVIMKTYHVALNFKDEVEGVASSNGQILIYFGKVFGILSFHISSRISYREHVVKVYLPNRISFIGKSLLMVYVIL